MATAASGSSSGMADVFVSYARSDKARVAPLVAVLESQGWSVWWDTEIATGQEFDRQISTQLPRCDRQPGQRLSLALGSTASASVSHSRSGRQIGAATSA